MKTRTLGYDHAVQGKSPDSTLAYDPYYLDGYRDGLIIKVEWAKQDLECFEAEYLLDLAE